MIRDFHPADLQAVQELLSGIPEAAQWSSDDLLSGSGKNLCARVSENEGVIEGLVVFRIAADEAEILNLAVDSRRRREGMGSRLMEDAIGECKAAGVKKIFLEVRESNGGGLKFYSQMGFRENGRRRHYYRQPVEDALVLVRTVESVRKNS